MSVTIEKTMKDGSQVKLELGFNPFKALQIARTYPDVNQVFSIAAGEAQETMDLMLVAKAVYVAYRNAHLTNFMTFEEFYDEDTGYDFNPTEDIEIYVAMLDKASATEYAEKLAKLAKKKKGKAK